MSWMLLVSLSGAAEVAHVVVQDSGATRAYGRDFEPLTPAEFALGLGDESTARLFESRYTSMYGRSALPFFLGAGLTHLGLATVGFGGFDSGTLPLTAVMVGGGLVAMTGGAIRYLEGRQELMDLGAWYSDELLGEWLDADDEAVRRGIAVRRSRGLRGTMMGFSIAFTTAAGISYLIAVQEYAFNPLDAWRIAPSMTTGAWSTICATALIVGRRRLVEHPVVVAPGPGGVQVAARF